MYIDVNDFDKRKNSSKDINISIEPNDIFIGNSEVKAEEKINFSGTVSKAEDIIYLNGMVDGLLALTCSRCLEGFTNPLALEINEKFSSVPNDEDDSLIFIDSDKINLTELIENNILMSLPIKKLCSEDCKGLCQNCGSNLNQGLCSCDNSDIDPRLAGLKDLFFTE
jgi:uncharacterized protein